MTEIRTLADAERFLAARVAEGRKAAAAQVASRGDLVRSFLIDKELALADDPHHRVSACCGRRAGKSTTMAAVMLMTALKSDPRFKVLYLGLTQGSAKDVIWAPLKSLNERFELGGKPNEADLTMTMPNGVVIALHGVDKRKEIEKRRGNGFALVVIDECQSIPEHVKSLVQEVIDPALMDAPGRLFMIGTPSLVRGGYWFDCHHNDKASPSGKPIWGHHYWDVFSNPHISNPQAVIDEVLAERGVTIEHASIQREYLGRWVRDTSSAVFAFDAARNSYSELPRDLDPNLWQYVIAVDIGGGVERDNDAVTVLAFHPHAKATWLKEEHVSAKQDVTALSLKVLAIMERLGPRRVVAVVADTGGIGAKVAFEMSSRHGIPVSPAKKADKWANIELLNAACRHGEFFAPVGSQFATECVKVEKDWAKSTPDRIAIKGHMPDACDSALYGFVESLAWTSKTPEPQLAPGSKQWAEREQRRLFQRAQFDVEREKQRRQDWEAGTWEMEDFS